MDLTLFYLCAFAFLAGFIDAVAGGGGLVQVPALFVLMPGVPAATLLGTNKFASIWGTLLATYQYSRQVPMEWRATLPTCAAALVFGYLGAQVVAIVPTGFLRPLVLVLLVAGGAQLRGLPRARLVAPRFSCRLAARAHRGRPVADAAFVRHPR
jgi:uncharacterized membrane protein YfcA